MGAILSPVLTYLLSSGRPGKSVKLSNCPYCMCSASSCKYTVSYLFSVFAGCLVPIYATVWIVCPLQKGPWISGAAVGSPEVVATALSSLVDGEGLVPRAKDLLYNSFCPIFFVYSVAQLPACNNYFLLKKSATVLKLSKKFVCDMIMLGFCFNLAGHWCRSCPNSHW